MLLHFGSMLLLLSPRCAVIALAALGRHTVHDAQLVCPRADVLRFGLLLLGSAVLTIAALAGIAKQVGFWTAVK
jgi:hypothetical protein